MTGGPRRPRKIISLLLAGRPLLAAQEFGIRPSLLERWSRIAGHEGSATKRAARLGLYLTLRLGGELPGSARITAAAARLSPRLHDALLRRYIAYGSNGLDWRPRSSAGKVCPGAHEAAILARLGRMASPHR